MTGMRRWLVLAVLLGVGCRITDAEIRREIAERGGEIISAENQFTLETVAGSFQVGTGGGLMAGGSIEIRYVGPPCREYCWEQVFRELIDDGDKLVPVTDFAKTLPPGATRQEQALAARQTDRQYRGYAVDTLSATRDSCLAAYRFTPNFRDEPNIPDSLFGTNRVNPSARVIVLEFETCVRCLRPPGPILGCVKWYYVKVLDDKVVGRPTAYLVTTGQAQPGPSAEFRQAVANWRR